MWHPLAFVAESRRLDEKRLTEFALSNQVQYGIVVERGVAEVNTWHVDALVRDFKASDTSREGDVL
ncbi:MAG: hypothetical protein K8L99_30675 [Anaerolineae bacterium]|nr:hypothetical protein [Anaerolineae bacterium]